jgi:hypothetical protein
MNVLSQNSHCWSNLICRKIYSTERLCNFLLLYLELLRERERGAEKKPTKNLKNRVADMEKWLCGDVSSIMIITRFKSDHNRKLFNGRLYF